LASSLKIAYREDEELLDVNDGCNSTFQGKIYRGYYKSERRARDDYTNVLWKVLAEFD